MGKPGATDNIVRASNDSKRKRLFVARLCAGSFIVPHLRKFPLNSYWQRDRIEIVTGRPEFPPPKGEA